MGLRDAQGLSGAAQFSGSAGWGGVVVVEVSGCLLPQQAGDGVVPLKELS